MSDINMILAWKPETLEQAAASWRGAGRRLADAAEKVARSVDSVPIAELAGPIREEGASTAKDRAARLRRDAAALDRFAGELEGAGKRITAAQNRLALAVADAERDDFLVDRATGLVLSNGARAKSVTDLGGTAMRLGHHRQNIANRVREAMVADERSANQLRDQFPAGAHLTTPGMPLGRVEGVAGLPALQAAEVERVRGSSGYEAGAEVEVIDTDPGTTAVALGDPRTAEHVITLVPGTGSTAEELERHIERARWMHGPDVAVIAWTYDAPPGLVSAASAEYHDRAATSFQAFQSQVAENPNTKLTVMGHSYGATLVAQSTKGKGLHADAVVLAGSPGAGPGVKTVKDMRLNKQDGTPHDPAQNGRRVITVTSPDDPIKFVGAIPLHGADVNSRWFGANRMDITDRVESKDRFFLNPRGRMKAHTEDYFPDPVFRERLDATTSTIPGSGPGSDVRTGSTAEPDPGPVPASGPT
ncbi:alpha/beta hydrolase [Corynebacterium sp. NPDC060344]|uniref:alpha/beta hydrolase n=1 Tax=Corynebacterium sp. NPDC060344 TaxID=3347101 RepID=UPI00365C5797